MIEILFEIIADALLKSELGVELRKLLEQPILKKIHKAYKFGKSLSNPQQYFQKFLHNLKPHELETFNNTLSRYVRHANFQKLYIKKLSQLKNLPIKSTSDFLEQIKQKQSINQLETLPDIDVIKPLKSSWLSSGIYIPLFKSSRITYGTLELTLKNGKSYAYINVTYTTWENMLSDKTFFHKTGLGKSGSAFWRGYLDNYIQITRGKTTKERTTQRVKSQQAIYRRLTPNGYNVSFSRQRGFHFQRAQRTR